jgi:hypothetical protein
MDELEKEALEILRSAFRVDQYDNLNEFKTKYKQWLLQGTTQIWATGQNFDRVRQAYHVYVKYLTRLHKESQVGGDPTSYQEFVADALANGNYAAAFTAYFRALFGTPFVLRYADANGKRAGSHVLSRRTPLK